MRRVLALSLLVFPGLAPGVSPVLAQAVPRADTPRRGFVRLTIDPTTLTWQDAYVDGVRRPLGTPLTSGDLGAAELPTLATLQQQVNTAGGFGGFLASLGPSRLGIRAERRITMVTAEVGISDRLAIGVHLPLVRVNTRARLTLDTAGGTLGLNPRVTNPALDSLYTNFQAAFTAALAQLDANILANNCGPRGCAAAQAFRDSALAVQASLLAIANSALLPWDGSAGGQAIAANVARIQAELAGYGAGGFNAAFTLPDTFATAAAVNSLVADSLLGFGASPFADTRRSQRFWAGDAEVTARYRVVAGPGYSATVGVLLRLPTGHQDSPHNLVDLSSGDHQTDLEGSLVQELLVANRLWLNLAVRAGQQRPGTRERRVAPADAFLVPKAAWSRLTWDPGDYLGVDFAPMLRLNARFAAGMTVGYWSKTQDRYRFATPQDSIDLAGRLGGPVSAAILDAQTAERRVRLGGAITYVGPRDEAGVSVEQTISGAAGGTVPAATVFRIVMRTSRRLF
jgi:hypothetical protein